MFNKLKKVIKVNLMMLIIFLDIKLYCICVLDIVNIVYIY